MQYKLRKLRFLISGGQKLFVNDFLVVPMMTGHNHFSIITMRRDQTKASVSCNASFL